MTKNILNSSATDKKSIDMESLKNSVEKSVNQLLPNLEDATQSQSDKRYKQDYLEGLEGSWLFRRNKKDKKTGKILQFRNHAGGDMYTKSGTKVFAIMDGTLIVSEFINKSYWERSDAIAIDHGSFIGRYCEITVDKSIISKIKLGKDFPIAKGTMLGTIYDQTGKDMLHYEMYSKTASGYLSTPKTPGKFLQYRRSDLMNPTTFLRNGWDRVFFIDQKNVKY